MYYPGWLKKLYYGALHLNNNIGEFYLQRLRGSAANLCFQKTLYSSACVYTGEKGLLDIIVVGNGTDYPKGITI
jgi:hypothetical protein